MPNSVTILLKNNCDMKTISFVSFKIDKNQEKYEKLLNPEIWPSVVLVGDFKKVSKNRNPQPQQPMQS